MRHGQESLIALVDNKVLAFGTGSDFCTEHECGYKPTLEHFTTAPYGVNAKDIAASLKRGLIDSIPQLADMKRITKNLSDIVLVEDGGYTMLGFPRRQSELVATNREITGYSKEIVSGAWDEHSFVIATKDARMRQALRDFHVEIQAGNAIFAGLFTTPLNLKGVIVGNAKDILARYRKEIHAAQKEFESKVKLELVSRVTELDAIRFAKCKGDFSHIWAVWNKDETEACYSINPGHATKADWGGRHSFETMKNWLESGMSYKLGTK